MLAVIFNWPERIKTQPHDDRDNCFLPFDSKGPCGMKVFNDIDDDSDPQLSSSECLIEEIPCRKGLFRVGTPLTKMVVPVHAANVTIRTCPPLLLLHFAEDRFISGNQVKPARSEALAQSITSHASGKIVCYRATCVYPSHHIGLI